jgi:hypothetical protein
MDRKIARNAATIALIVAALISPSVARAQQQVSVVVNGQTMSFDQPPIVQSGRVFVPLRGVFEQLGASVVYANGQINATGDGRTVSLTIGSTQAVVDGQPQTLDVAPFVVGSRTLVPLRFVAQALGATVNWNDSNSTVMIASSGRGPNNGNRPNNYPPPPDRSFYLTNQRPTQTVSGRYNAIHANFSQPVRSGSLRVMVDGNDMTSSVYGNANGFDLTVRAGTLGPGQHRVVVRGMTASGQRFETGWSFTSVV